MPPRTTAHDPFASLLDELRSTGPEPASHVRLRPVGNPGYQVQFSPDAPEPATPAALGGLYVDDPLPERGRQDLVASPPLSTEPTVIAAEIGLLSARTADELHRLRRRFALANHPDRLDAAFREIATLRMMIANRLIDEALARLETLRS